MKPILNLDEVGFADRDENGVRTSSRSQISGHIGARKLGYNLSLAENTLDAPIARRAEEGQRCG